MSKWKWRIILGLALVVAFATNHAEHYLRAERIRRQGQEKDVPVMRVVDNAAGHSSIQIDEQTHRRGYLYFNTLESWAYSKDSPSPCPPSVMEANGREVKLTGFMYPLQGAANLTVFCLLRSTQTCCYGPRPQYNQYVFVEMAHPVKFERLAPVVVEGQFVVDPKPEEGYIYRMEGLSVRPAVPNDQPASAADFARQNNLPVFDFATVEAAKAAPDRESAIARLAADLDGKQMVLQGFIVGKTAGPPARVMIGKYAWDGKAKGTPPGLYNTVLVSPRGTGDVPPVWWQEAVFKGTIRVTREPSDRASKGIVSLQDATLAVAPASPASALADAGPVLPPLYEFMILTVWGGTLLLGRLSKRSCGNNSPASPGDKK
jgi:hypothetical protein